MIGAILPSRIGLHVRYWTSGGGVYGTLTQLSSSSPNYAGVWPFVYPFRLRIVIYCPWLCVPWRPVIYGGLRIGVLSPGHCSAAEHLPLIASLVRRDEVEPWLNQAPSFSTSALRGGNWSPSHPGRFVLSPKLSSELWEGGWVGPTACLNLLEKRKISCSCWKSKFDFSGRLPHIAVTIPTLLM